MILRCIFICFYLHFSLLKKKLNGNKKELLGEFHSSNLTVSGQLYLTNKKNEFLIKNFTFDSKSHNAFFGIGTKGKPGPGSSVKVIPGNLKRIYQKDILLTLPSNLTIANTTWISAYTPMWSWSSRTIGADLGHVIIRKMKKKGQDYMDIPGTEHQLKSFRMLHNFVDWDAQVAKISTVAQTITSETGLDYKDKDTKKIEPWDPKLEELYLDAYAEDH